MALFPLDIPPGVYRNGTNYQSMGRWFAAAFMRWFENTLRPFGGWAERSSGMTGPARGMITWRPSDIAPQALLGTTNHLYRWDGDSLLDITPGGLAAGVEVSVPGAGYGSLLYSAGPFGVPNTDAPAGDTGINATVWSFDTWGDNVLAVNNTDQVLREYASDDAPPSVVANAPPGIFTFVTAERIAVLLGADSDARLMRWSDFENNTLWAPDSNNAAGDWRFQTSGKLVAGARMRGTNLIWTTDDVWRMDFISGTLVYRIEQLAANCGLVGPRAFAVVDDGAIWMGFGNFFAYAGGNVAPMPCEIRDYVFWDINMTQRQLFHTGRIAEFGEVLFFYCSAGSNTVDRCVSYNTREGHWNIVDPDGVMARGSWADTGAFARPLAAADDGTLYEQETGWTAAGETLVGLRYAQSGPVQLGSGDRVLEATMLLPDDESAGNVELMFAQKFTPKGPVYNRGPYSGTAYTDIRLTGRQVAMLLTPQADADFRIGKYRLDGQQGGRR
jgi:hypothetical protein